MFYRDNMTNEQGDLAAAVAGTAPTKHGTDLELQVAVREWPTSAILPSLLPAPSGT
jgi:hypothetical protein